ncbi:MAG TPA: DNA polymerase III subunit alpha [Anaerolineae bacterium]|nr:DNA polymerase III subunit alpha [Anaerolineae bacterium]
MPEFVHLHTHTEYSLLDGLSSPKALAERAAGLGMNALAITDHGVMYGAVDFYKACKAVGIKPLIGMEAYVAPESRFSHDRADGKAYHLILLAQNQQGYRNLLALASLAQLEGFYYKPRVDREALAQYSEGLIALSACLQGEIPRLLLEGQEEQAREAARWYQEHFPGRFYLELQSHAIPEQERANAQLIALARELGLPLVATNDIHYAREDQYEAHDVLLCIGTGKLVAEANRMRMSDNSYFMRSPQEMAQLYAHVPEALENTVRIAEQCNVEIAFAPPYHLPQFPVPEAYADPATYLRHLCDQGMVRRYGQDATRPEYRQRLEYELDIIHRMGFDDYFLIVWDLCRAAERRDIWWNVRGSGAGSVVAYTLEITNVEPFKNRLFFERFLNPDRISMPDIDLDFPDDRRDELITYAAERYGADKVCGIITFGTLGARAAIRDVGRAQGIPLNEVDRVARLVPNIPGKPVSIAEALETLPELKEIYDTTPYLRKLLDTAQQLEGVARHASTHAAGVIVSDRPLTDYLPLNRPTKSDGETYALDRVSQWAMDVVEALGMLKVDFLGLRTLTHMRKTCELIEQEHGRKLDLNTIPYERVPDDPVKDADVKALYDLLASGETTGVFQVEGAGMRRTLQEMRPFQFQHIIAAIALYRPGPMENIPTYIKRLHGEEPITYRHPILENILDDTFSVLIYQEQIMQIAVEMAGYQPGQADEIRKAVAKKKKDLMEKHQRMFREGAQARGIPAEIADAVWGDIEFFARYGFNRAHATDYAVITAQTAYLKAHYPLEFMTALMTTERNNVEKLGFLIADARRTGLPVLGPSLNHSDVEFTIAHQPDGQRAIRIGLSAIKNVGEEAVRLIVENRKNQGPFTSLDDFAHRVDLRKVNRRALECLMQAGALDEFGPRPALLALLDTLLNVSTRTHAAQDVGQFSLFGDFSELGHTITLPPQYPPVSSRQILEWEKELLGVYLSEHPLAQQERELLALSLTNTTLERLSSEPAGRQLTALGMVQRIRRITTKKGDMMAFVTLEGPGGAAEVVVFPRTYERCRELLTEGRVLVVSGKLDARAEREDPPLLADWLKAPQELLRPAESAPPAEDPFVRETPPVYAPAPPVTRPAPAESPARVNAVTAELPPEEPPAAPATLCVTLQRTANLEADYERLRRLYQVMQAQEGEDHFIIYLQNGEAQGPRRVQLTFPNDRTRITPALRQQLEGLVGPGNIRVVLTSAAE